MKFDQTCVECGLMVLMVAAYLNALVDRMSNLMQMVCVSGLILTCVELCRPIEKQSLASRLKGIVSWIIYIVLTVILTDALIRWLGLAQATPLLRIDLSNVATSPNLVVAILGNLFLPFLWHLIFDFFYYWFHRCQHTFPLLWRSHAIHHSIEEMNAFNCSNHFLEEVLSMPFVLIPMTLVFKVDIGYALPLVVVLRGWSQFIHANIKVNLGPLKFVVASPQFHRIHHSRYEKHFDRNFAAFFPLWDILFGTAYFTKQLEFPRTGMREVREFATVKEFLFRPFLKQPSLVEPNPESSPQN